MECSETRSTSTWNAVRHGVAAPCTTARYADKPLCSTKGCWATQYMCVCVRLHAAVSVQHPFDCGVVIDMAYRGANKTQASTSSSHLADTALTLDLRCSSISQAHQLSCSLSAAYNGRLVTRTNCRLPRSTDAGCHCLSISASK